MQYANLGWFQEIQSYIYLGREREREGRRERECEHVSKIGS